MGDGEGAELVEVQDAAFPIKIQVPGVELFELQVGGGFQSAFQYRTVLPLVSIPVKQQPVSDLPM